MLTLAIQDSPSIKPHLSFAQSSPNLLQTVPRTLFFNLFESLLKVILSILLPASDNPATPITAGSLQPYATLEREHPEQRYTTAPPSVLPTLGKSSDSVVVRHLLHPFGQTSQEELYPVLPVDIVSAGLGGESGTLARHQLAKHKSFTT